MSILDIKEFIENHRLKTPSCEINALQVSMVQNCEIFEKIENPPKCS